MKAKKITIGLFNDTFFPMVDGVVSVVDNYARLLSKKANVCQKRQPTFFTFELVFT